MNYCKPAVCTRFTALGAAAFLLATLFFTSQRARAQNSNGTWVGTGGPANWSDLSQWQGNTAYADGIGSIADLSTSTLGSDQAISLDIAITVGVLNIGDTGGMFKYDIGGPFALTFDNTGFGNAQINVTGTSAGDTISAAVILTSSLDITNASANAFTISGAISGAAGITTTGPVIFSGNNTYSGTTTISSGTLQIGNGGTSGTLGSGNVTDNGALSFNRSDSTTVSNDISGTGTLSQNGTGTLTLSGNNSYTGGTTINAGTLALGTSDVLADTGAVTVNGGTFDISSFNDTVGAVSLTSGSITGTTGVLTGSSYTVASGSVSAILGGTGALTKSTAGTVTLSGANTYTGGTTVSGGTLQIGASERLADTGALTVSGGTFNLQSFNETLGAVTLTSGSIIGSGTLTASSYSVESGTISAILGGSAALTKSAAGTVVLSGANTYSGGTSITGGVLQLSGSGTLGSTTATLSIGAGQLDLNGTSQTVGALTGSGGGGNNIRNTLASTTSVLTIGNGDASGTFSGVIDTGAGTIAIVKTGTGTQIFSGSNTYTGTTTINGGILNIQHSNGLGSATGGTIVNNGGTLQLQGGVSLGDALTLSGTGATNATGALESVSGTNAWTGNVALAANSTIAVDAGSFTISGVISGTGSSLTKVGAGALTLTKANTFTGGASINSGTLTIDHKSGLGTGTVTIGSSGGGNATLATTFAATGVTGGTMTNNFVVASGSGGTLSLTNDQNNAPTFSGTFTLNGDLTVSGVAGAANPMVLTGAISGAGALTKANTGFVTLSGSNSYSGGTILNSGTLNINSSSAIGTGTFTINGGTFDNTTGAAITLTTNNAQDWNSNFTFTGTRSLDMGTGAVSLGSTSSDTTRTVTVGGNTLTIGGVISNGATTTGLTKAGAGTLLLSGANTYTGGTTITAGTLQLSGAGTLGSTTGSLTVNGGTLNLNGTTQTVGALNGSGGSILNNSGTSTLTVGNGDASGSYSGTLAAGTGTLALTKTGTGTLALSGNNTYTGTTTISGGILNIQSNTALGSATGGTTVASGATLQLQHATGLSVGGEALNLSGTGALGQSGALVNVSGANSYAGLITLGASSVISVDSGSLSLTNAGTIGGSGFDVTLTGAGSGTLASIIGTGSGSLTKSGTGTWTLTGANTYSGTTSITAGVLNIQNASGLGATTNGTTVSSGAALELQGSLAIGAEALTLNGTGISGTGALRSISGTSSWAGALTLGSDSSIGVDAGSLTISGAVAGSGFALSKVGGGTLTLTGTNTYTGDTTISAGTLQLGNGGATGSLAGSSNIIDNGALIINRSNAITQGTNFGTISGTGSFTQAGSGTTTLTAANTYTGATNINAGTLIVNGSLGNTDVTVASGATLGGTGTIGTASGGSVTVNSGGAINLLDSSTATLTIQSTSGSNSLSLLGGSISLEIGPGLTSDRIALANGTNLLLSGNVTLNITGISGYGAGTYTLVTYANWSGTGSFSLGSVPVGAFNFSLNQTANSLQLIVTAVTSAYWGGTENNFWNANNGGATNWFQEQAGTTNLTNFLPDASTDVFFTTDNATANFATELGQDISIKSLTVLGNTPTANNAVSIAGTGGFTLTIGLGGITVNSGAAGLTISSAVALGAAQTWTNSSANAMTVSGVVSGSGSLTKAGTGTLVLSGNNTFTGALTVADGTLSIATINNASTNGVLGNSAGAVTLGGTSTTGTLQYTGSTASSTKPFSLAAGGGVFQIDTAATNLTLSGVVSGSGALSKTGLGTLTLSGANSYTGATTITTGVLNIQNNTALGGTDSGTTVNTGTALQMLGNISVGAEVLTLNGDGVSSTGALRSISGTNSWSGDITLATNSTIGVDAGTLTLSGVVSGTGINLTKVGAGTLTLSGGSGNSYTGTTTINEGELDLGKTAGTDAIAGNIIIGDGSGTDTLKLLADNQIANTAVVFLNNSGSAVFDLAGKNETIAGLDDLTTGASTASVLLGSGTLTLGNTISRTFSGVISGSGNIVKQGVNSTQTFKGANTYSGTTTISQGVLNIQNNTGLGATAGGTTVASGAALELQGGISVGAETLSLAGTGVSNGGALRSVNGNNSWGGLITLTAASRINSDAGTLTLDVASGNAITGTFALTLGGSGNIIVADPIATGTGTLTKDGSGILTLSAANTYSGGTILSAGTLVLGNSSALGPTTSSLTVNGGTLDLNGFALTVGTLSGSGGTILNNATGTNLTLTASSSSNSTYSGIIADHTSGTGTVALTKSGTGALTLAGANTYSGGTTLTAGTLTFSGSGTLGSTSATLTINGGTLDLGGTSQTVGALNGSGGTITNNVNGNSTLTIGQGNGSGSYAGVITDPASGTKRVALTKTGTGTETLSGNNSYTLATTVSQGILNIQHTNALGTTAAGTTVGSGATLQLQGGVSFAAEALTLNGTGASGQNGALVNVSGNNTWAGAITLGSASTIASDSGTLTLSNTATIATAGFLATFNAAGNITANGVISGTGGLTKVGAGTLTLGAADTYTGATTISAGTLKLGVANAIGSSSAVTDNATLDLGGFSDAIGSLAGTGTVTSSAAGSVTLTAGADNTSTTFSGLIQNGSGTVALTKTGTGTLTLSGANTYSGLTTASAGTLILNGTNSSSGATTMTGTSTILQLGSGANGGLASGLLSLGAGRIQSTDSGARTVSNAVQFTANTTFGSSTTGALTFNGAVDLNGGTRSIDIQSNTTFNGVISGAGFGITKAGGASTILTLAGTNANTYTGATTINFGEIDLNKTAGVNAIAGNVTIGDISSTDTLKLLASDQIIDTADVTLSGASAGTDVPTFNLNGFSETIDALISNNPRASVALGSGTLTVGANGETSATFAGVISGTGGSLTKTGAGTQILSGANTYTGATSITGGVLNIQNATALGTTAGGTTVSTGAALQIQSNIAVGAEALTLNGTGISSTGALRNISGTNSWSGAITLGSNSTIGSDAGTLTLSGIVSGAFTLGKVGAGILTFSGSSANTYSGLTTVSAGELDLSKTAGINAISGDGNTATADVTISGGTLKWLASNQVADDATIAMSSGTFSLNGFTETLFAFSNSGGTFTTGTGTLIGTGASITWSGGTNTINNGGTVQDGHVIITGGTNTVNGGSAGGVLRVLSGGAGLEMTGSTLTLDSSANVAGKLLLDGNVTTNASATTSTIATGGGGSSIGNVDLNGATRTFTVADGAAATDLLIATPIINGALTKAGAGLLALSGTNTYSGTTTISAGTLQVGAAGNTGTLGSGNVVDNAVLAFNRTDSPVVSNNISGSGDLNQIGAGTTILTGTNTYSGTTTISAGTLQIGNGGTTGTLGTGNVVDNGALIFNRSNTLSVANLISGTGSVTQAGTGTTTLSANNTYTGVTAVNAGTLMVNGSLSSGSVVSVASTATLGGTGTVAGSTSVSGTLRGGDGTTGTSLTVGNLTMNSGSVIQLALGPSFSHSTLALTGNYAFQGTQQFNFIELSGVTTGTYENIITGLATDPGANNWTITNPLWVGTFNWDGANIDLTLIAVPEPGTWAGATLALVGLLAHQRRRIFRRRKTVIG